MMLKIEQNILKISTGMSGYKSFKRENFNKEQLKEIIKWCLEGV
jgi:hypothetical protein